VTTGKHTGRSPKDKFVVREPSVEPHIWWDNNAPMAPEHFDAPARRHARAHRRAASSSCRISMPVPIQRTG
jgi:ATP-dependent phosphoenolpyruvate carboxykinase